MSTYDLLWAGMLVVSGGLVWAHDPSWMQAASETLPVLAALPLFYWLGGPWRLKHASKEWTTSPSSPDPSPIGGERVPEGGRGSTFSVSQRFLGKPSGFELHLPALIASAGALLLGFVLDLTLLYAAAWTLALWSWIRARTVPATAGLGQLAVLPLMAFPWINLDFAPLGWWFRISAAWIAEHGFSGLGFLVARQGTSLVVHGLPIDVAPACSGMHALQTILIAGIALSWVKLGGRPTFWLAVATLPALAWIANALRICATVFVALNWGTPFAQEHFHDVGGWVVMMGVLALWWMALGTSSTRLRCQPASP